MLSKNICKKCINRNRKKLGKTENGFKQVDNKWDSDDDMCFDGGTILCPDRKYAVTKQAPPIWCKYSLEHAVDK
jgi:hypothetical protein